MAGTPLRLYLVVSHNAINGLIAQEIEGEERPISYLSRMLKDVETRYNTQEKFCLGVVYAAQKYRQYFQVHTIQIISKSEGIKFMLSNGAINGRVSRWALLLSEHDIQILQPQKLGCQALADMMALCPGQHEEEVTEEIRGEVPEVNECRLQKKEWWIMKFDGTPSSVVGGAGVVIARGEKDSKIVAFQNVAEPSLSLVSYEVERADWRKPILSQFKQKIFTKANRDFHELRGRLCKKGTDVLLMKCVTEVEGGEKAECLHQAICGQGGPSLYRRMQRVGMYWPSMKACCNEMQRACPHYREESEMLEVNAIENDWRKTIKEFILFGTTPDSPREAEKLRKRA
ncbi:hypothetical protein SESBI_21508 [Sesbania bispinosa]|nr:hypothetical protein SESBI_21508 [Sesbania bispinosa]